MKALWQDIQLNEVFELAYGKALPKHKRSKTGLYPVYGANGIKDRTNLFLHDKKTIIVGRKGSAGEITLSDKKFWPLDVTYYLRFDEKQYDLYFLYYLLKFHNLSKYAKGVKPGINRNDIYSIKQKIPFIPEQKRIVKILDEAFAAIDKAIENTEENIKNYQELFDSYLNSVFENPGEDWEKCELIDKLNFIDYRGKTPKKTTSGLQLITAKNVKMNSLSKHPAEFVSPNCYDEWMTRGIPKKGDILITTEAPLGNIAQLDTDQKVVFAQRIIILQPKNKEINPTFIKYYLMSNSFQNTLKNNGTGATVKGIKSKILKKLPLIYPSDLISQNQIITNLNTIYDFRKNLIKNQQKKLSILKTLKQSLLQKAFNGEL